MIPSETFSPDSGGSQNTNRSMMDRRMIGIRTFMMVYWNFRSSSILNYIISTELYQGCIPVGCVPPACWPSAYIEEGDLPMGRLPPGPGGGGVCLPHGIVRRQTPYKQKHKTMSENITFSQLCLRMVTISINNIVPQTIENNENNLKLIYLSRNCHFERISSLQCYEFTRRCSHLPFT